MSRFEFESRTHSRPSASELFQLFVVLGVYTVLGLRMAASRSLWNDELFTLHVARADSLGGIWAALRTGADQLSPLIHVLIRTCERFIEDPHVAARIPSLIGFGVLMTFLWLFLRPRFGASWATLAATFVMTTGALEYAVEARGYALLLGSSAVAFWAWSLSCLKPRSWLYPAVVLVALAWGFASHYYGAFSWIPIAVGELAFMIRNGFRLRIAVAQVLALFPLALLWPLIRQAENYREHFWAGAAPSDLLGFPDQLLGPSLAVLVLAACAVSLLTSNKGERDLSTPTPGLGFHERVAALTFAGLPFLVMFVAVFITRAYTDRYVIAALLGWVVVLVEVGFRLSLGRKLVGFLAVCFLVFAGLSATHATAGWNRNLEAQTDYWSQLMAACPERSIVLNDLKLFLRSDFYAPRVPNTRFYFVADVEQAIEWTGRDTQNRGALDLRDVFPEGIVTLDQYHRLEGDVCVMGASSPEWSWFQRYLLAQGQTLELLELVYGIPVYRVQRDA